MKVRLRQKAKADFASELRYYRHEAGVEVAKRLRARGTDALTQLGIEPGLGSPLIGQALGIEGLRSWRLNGFPLSFWYLVREDFVDVVRLVGQRQDRGVLEVEG